LLIRELTDDERRCVVPTGTGKDERMRVGGGGQVCRGEVCDELSDKLNDEGRNWSGRKGGIAGVGVDDDDEEDDVGAIGARGVDDDSSSPEAEIDRECPDGDTFKVCLCMADKERLDVSGGVAVAAEEELFEEPESD
jgi:hypothetical protein